MILALKKALLRPTKPSNDSRKVGRCDLVEPCRVERWGRPFHAMTRNISAGGMCLEIVGMGSTTLDADVLIYLRDFEPIEATARWSHKRTFGMQFQTPIEDHPEICALLKTLPRQF